MFHSYRSWSLILLILFISPLARAEVEMLDPGPFYGFWEIQENAGDACVLIVKRGGRLSCFWSGTSNSRFQKGSWERSGDILTVRWDDGYIDIYKSLGENAIQRETYSPGKSPDGNPESLARGVRVDSRIPGSLTTDRGERTGIETPSPQEAPAIPARNAFTGFWEVEQDTGFLGIGNDQPHFYINLQRDGKVATALRNWNVEQGTQGTWKIVDDSVRIEWPDGQKDLLSPSSEESYRLSTWGRKQEWSDRPKADFTARKLSATEGARHFQAGEFQLLTPLDIRGVWVPREGSETREYIEIEGWGNAYRFPSTGGEGSDPGKWRLLNDRVIITWVDGSRDILRRDIVQNVFIQESYLPGAPVTAAPESSQAVRKIENR